MNTESQKTKIRLPELPEWDGYFVYVDRLPTGEPFYVGIGKARRVFVKVRNVLHDRICSKYDGCFREVVFLGDRPSALREERRLISVYGRINNGTGCLSNFTDGGDGGTGRVVTDEMRRLSSERMTKKYSTKEWKEYWRKSTKDVFSNEETRTKHHASIVRAWERSEVREKHRLKTVEAMSRPDVKARQSEGLRTVMSTPEFKEKRSRITRQVFSDQRIKEKQIVSLKRTMSSPEFRKGLSERSKEFNSRPEVVEKKSSATSRLHAARKMFIASTGYEGRYREITKEMCSEFFDKKLLTS